MREREKGKGKKDRKEREGRQRRTEIEFCNLNVVVANNPVVVDVAHTDAYEPLALASFVFAAIRNQ